MSNNAKTKQIDFGHLFSQVFKVLIPEKSFYFTAIVYGIGISLLTLAIPISVQSLVNTISFGVLTQPLIILSLLLLVLLFMSGFFKTLQIYIVELFQRKLYARVATDVSNKLLGADPNSFKSINGVELTNRYFDIMTLQKSVKVLIMDATAMFLQIIVGLLVLAFYHPYFLVFDFVLVFLIWMVWFLFGKRAIITAIKESTAKYEVAQWLEEIARENFFFKTAMRKHYAAIKTDNKIINYIETRKKHFRHLFSQHIFLMIIYAVMSALILGLGGFLVTSGQLTIGQLVASELIITLILASLAKSGKYLESFYDLIAGVNKVAKLIELTPEELNTSISPDIKNGDLVFSKVCFQSSLYQFNFDIEFKHGKNYLVAHKYLSSKNIFLDLLRGVQKARTGKISLAGQDYSSHNQLEIRDNIYIVEEPVIFAGSIWENLISCTGNVETQKVMEVLEIVDLSKIVDIFPEGMNTNLMTNGYPLWRSQQIRLEIARAIIMRPKVLVLTEVIDQLDDERRMHILKYLSHMNTTLIVFSNKDLGLENYESVALENKVDK